MEFFQNFSYRLHISQGLQKAICEQISTSHIRFGVSILDSEQVNS